MKYIYQTYKTGYAIVIRDGEPTYITHGDPEFDAWNEKVMLHLERSLVDDSTPKTPPV